MEKEEFSKLAMAIKTYYPKETILPNSEAMCLWYEALQDIPYEVASLSLRRWVSTNRWSPTIADIREMAAEVKAGPKKDWSEGWEQVIKSISKYGSYRQEEAIESLDEITRECVKRIGYYNICTSENIAADRANFRKIYEQLSERKHTEAQIPDKLLQMINKTLLEDKNDK